MPPPAHPLAGGCPDTDDVLVGAALDAIAAAAGLKAPAHPPPLHAPPADHGFTSRTFDLRVGERPATEVALLEAERSAEAAARTAEAVKVRAAAAAAHAEAAAAAHARAAQAAAAPGGGGNGAAVPAPPPRRLSRAPSEDGSAGGDGRSTEDGGGGGGGATPRSGRSGRRKPRAGPPAPRVPAIPPHIHAQNTFVAAGLEGMVAYIRSYATVGASADPPDAPGPGVRRCAKTAHARLKACLRDGVYAGLGMPPGPHPVVRKRDRSGEGRGGSLDGGGTPGPDGGRRSSRGAAPREGSD